MVIRTILSACVAYMLCITPASAQQDDTQRALELFAAYQGGYFQVVAVSCFQLYSSTGIIASDYEVGVIGGELAQSALERSRLLHSVCTTSLEDIRTATPVDDEAAHSEIARLGNLLIKLGGLFDALDAKFLNPTSENITLAEKALVELEFEMGQYTGSNQN